MKKVIVKSALFAMVGIGFVAGNSIAAGIYDIDFYQGGGVNVEEVFTSGQNASLATSYVDVDSGVSQNSAIYGAGFTMSTGTLLFNADLYTHDSYSNPDMNGNTGWWDGFFVNLNTTGYYWDIIGDTNDPLVDPNYAGGDPIVTDENEVLPGVTWAWGGADYGSNGLEQFKSDVNSYEALTLASFVPGDTVYVSFVLDTKTPPNQDENYASWGNFQAEPIPEPATMLLLGIGLTGLAGIGRRKTIRK